jgi:hypothetical protein
MLLVYHCNQLAGAKNKGIACRRYDQIFSDVTHHRPPIETPLRLSQTALPRCILSLAPDIYWCLEIFATMDDIAAIEAAAAVAAAAMSQQPPTGKFRQENLCSARSG